MNALERRASFSLALIYALRMLGLFMVLPVFMIEARHYDGGQDATAVGFAMGIYGLVQAALQIPFGLAADRWGRKPVIYFGLAIFAAGSFIAAAADSIGGVIIGRILQGAGNFRDTLLLARHEVVDGISADLWVRDGEAFVHHARRLGPLRYTVSRAGIRRYDRDRIPVEIVMSATEGRLLVLDVRTEGGDPAPEIAQNHNPIQCVDFRMEITDPHAVL